jgi:phosphopantetheinyl transferase
MLCVWSVESSAWEAHDDGCVLPYLTASEHHQLAKRPHPTKHREYLRSRFFMRYALANTPEAGCSDDWRTLRLYDGGKGPSLPECEVNLSLSHTRSGWMALAISNQPVGIDIEAHRSGIRVKERLEMILSDDEIAALTPEALNDERFFYRQWCSKESEFKWASHKSAVETEPKICTPLTSVWQREGYWLAVTAREAPHPTIRHINAFSKGVAMFNDESRAAQPYWQPS